METQAASQVAYCTLNCADCGVGNGTVSKAATALRGMLNEYGYPQWAPMMAEMVPATKDYPQFDAVLEWLTGPQCPGCKGGGGDPDCAIRLCAKEKGFSGCWECAEGECDKLKAMGGAYADVQAKRLRIREIGPGAWALEKGAPASAAGQ